MKFISLLIALVMVVTLFQGSFGKKKKVEQQDKDEDITDIITSEGEEGWLEKVLKKAKEAKEAKVKHEKKQAKYHDDSPPSNVISRLENKLDSLESAADDNNKGWTTRAKNGLRELHNNWLQTPETRRGEIVTALNTAASKLEKFANAGDDPVGAIRGAVEIIASFSSLAGPHGQIISVVLNFISGFLSLFGKGPSPKPLSQVVREEIEKWYSRDLSNQAEGSIFDFQTSRVFLNGVSKAGRNLTESESTALPSYVPVYNGVAFMGTLSSEIRNIIRGNEAEEAKKCLKYIELYTRMAILKDLVLQQMAALISDSQSSIRDGVYAYQDYLRSSAKALFKFLYESEIGSNIIPYFDPDKYKLTDAYMSEVLEIENYDRSMAGKYFVNVRMRSSYGRLGYVSAMPLVNYDDRGADLVFGGNFYWKLVPHGKNLFSIVNRYNCHANDDLCDAMLTWTESHGLYRVTIKHEDPALWEITRTSNSRRRRYRIRCKKGCNESPPHAMCNAEMSFLETSIGEQNYKIYVVIITKNGGKTWGFRKQ